jgi:hypothetical protein
VRKCEKSLADLENDWEHEIYIRTSGA